MKLMPIAESFVSNWYTRIENKTNFAFSSISYFWTLRLQVSIYDISTVNEDSYYEFHTNKKTKCQQDFYFCSTVDFSINC